MKWKLGFILENIKELDDSKIISLSGLSEVEYLMDMDGDGVEVDDENEENELKKGMIC